MIFRITPGLLPVLSSVDKSSASSVTMGVSSITPLCRNSSLPKCIQCDNGHKFENSSLQEFFLAHGVQLWMSCLYTSAQNGKVERMMHTTNNIIHTLLFQASMPPHYWIESLHTTTYLLNRYPTKTIIAPAPLHHSI
jgi:transposase InsO family protein